MAAFTVGEVEQFVSAEAKLLDEWRLEEWLALMAPDARYLVPPLDARAAEDRDTLFLIADDRRTLASRVRQLLDSTTWAEDPRSACNVQLVEVGDSEARGTVNFAVWRFQHGQTDVYVGRYVNPLACGAAGLMFRERRVELNLETLCVRTASSASSCSCSQEDEPARGRYY